MQMGLDIFIFSSKSNMILLFSQEVNSIRGHASSLLVLRKSFREDKTILI